MVRRRRRKKRQHPGWAKPPQRKRSMPAQLNAPPILHPTRACAEDPRPPWRFGPLTTLRFRPCRRPCEARSRPTCAPTRPQTIAKCTYLPLNPFGIERKRQAHPAATSLGPRWSARLFHRRWKIGARPAPCERCWPEWPKSHYAHRTCLKGQHRRKRWHRWPTNRPGFASLQQ